MITNRFRSLSALAALASIGLSAAIAGAAESATAIAGLAPFERPAGAPRMTVTSPADTPGGQALHGVSQPVPSSLKFLRDQGNWYTPFDRPGMPAPYDIRGWYANPPTARKH
jgi:hypothetical protein